MKVLITGASGFLGRHTVKALLDRGHAVHALVRPASDVSRLDWADNVQLVRDDLRRPTAALDGALAQVDAVVHLAAGTSGSEESQLADSVVATENLLASMNRHQVNRLVLASTFSVYAWHPLATSIDEQTPLDDRLYHRDGYAIAKTWQERIVRRWADEHRGRLTVIRPGYIWGEKLPLVAGVGLDTGRWLIVNGPFRRLPLTHVLNCADSFAAATEDEAAVGKTFNLVDSDAIRAWRFAGDYLRRSGRRATRLAVPYHLGLVAAHLAELVSWTLFGRGGKLPGVLMPIRYRARFKSARFPTHQIRETIGWQPPLGYQQCLEQTHAARPGAIPRPTTVDPGKANGPELSRAR